MTSSETIMSDYKEIFEGVGKLKDYQVKLHVNRLSTHSLTTIVYLK